MSNRIDSRLGGLKESGRKALVIYVTAGFPDVETSEAIIEAVVEAGADVIEIGVPFSDPLADGPSVQRSSFLALKNGVNLHTCLEMLRRLRGRDTETPMLFMGYYNPFLQYGLESFASEAFEAGLDGLIVPDLPAEEAAPLRDAVDPKGIHVIPLLAPTSTDPRIVADCARAGGFVYCVSVTGVTGARAQMSSGVSRLVGQIRGHTEVPIMVGFGVSTREHFLEMGKIADGVVVGSALIDAIAEAPRGGEVEAAVKFVESLKGECMQVTHESS